MVHGALEPCDDSPKQNLLKRAMADGMRAARARGKRSKSHVVRAKVSVQKRVKREQRDCSCM
jgi:hypothetical protein